MGLNAQLAIKARMRAKAMLEAQKLKEYENFINTDFLEEIKGIWPATKQKLVNLNLTSYEALKNKTKDDLLALWFTIPTAVAIDRYIAEQNKKFKEIEILEKSTATDITEEAEELVIDNSFDA